MSANDGLHFTLTDLEALAEGALEPRWHAYVAGGAGAERTVRENVAAFGRYRLRQRVLAGIEQVDLRTTVLGVELGLPVLCAPVAYQTALHRDGEVGHARAAGEVGAGFCLSTFANVTPTDVAAGSPARALLYQVYVFRDRGVTDELIRRALGAGFRAIVLTVDLPVVGSRDRELRHDWKFVDSEIPSIMFAADRGMDRDGVDVIDPTIDWAYLEQLCGRFDVPVAVKGVLEPEDARRAAACGAAAVVVSNHGGRQLEPTHAAIDALPAVVDSVGDRVEVLVDGGVRRGGDIAVALALGARAVLVGRLPIYGLAVAGEAGVRRALELLRDELAITLHLMGCRSVAEVGPDCVTRAGTIGAL
jgi:isopentenyl diphosphate isomerase/L-lactate dehydrogenase-like FMN-dependent dehydrogenase